MFSLRPLVLALGMFWLPACSFILDFDDVDDLPCPCDADHVCLIAAQRCVPRASVDDYKSCSKDTENQGDDLCRANRICQAVNDLGPRCLPQCVPSNYATPDAGAAIAAQCAQGYTCWDTDRGGVCSEGVCDPSRNTCAPAQQCVAFNGAGVCFTECEIFRTDPPPCLGGQACHPIGDSRVTACIDPGTRTARQLCSHADPCAAKDANARPMICSRPQSSSAERLCYPMCRPGDGTCSLPGENCTIAKPNIDPDTGADLGICTGGI